MLFLIFLTLLQDGYHIPILQMVRLRAVGRLISYSHFTDGKIKGERHISRVLEVTEQKAKPETPSTTLSLLHSPLVWDSPESTFASMSSDPWSGRDRIISTWQMKNESWKSDNLLKRPGFPFLNSGLLCHPHQLSPLQQNAVFITSSEACDMRVTVNECSWSRNFKKETYFFQRKYSTKPWNVLSCSNVSILLESSKGFLKCQQPVCLAERDGRLAGQPAAVLTTGATFLGSERKEWAKHALALEKKKYVSIS